VKEREEVAEELRRVREEVRERGLAAPRSDVLPAPLPPRTPEPMPPDPGAPAAPAIPHPDTRVLNEAWRLTTALEGGGLRRRLARGLGRLLARVLESQESFNSRQVQFDNEILAYVDARLDATHRHYDEVLGIHSRHMAEIDERHLILQEELVAHVHDLVKRIDLVLGEAEKGRLSLEFALQDLRARLVRLEERVRGVGPGGPGPSSP
jgi:hypothetical protein